MDTITLGSRLVESSPAIVVVLLLGHFVWAKLLHLLLMRLDAKDAAIEKAQHSINEMQRETVEAMHSMRDAVAQLSVAIKDSTQRR